MRHSHSRVAFVVEVLCSFIPLTHSHTALLPHVSKSGLAIAWICAIIPAIFAFYYLVFFKLGPQPFSLLPTLSLYPSQAFVNSDAYLSFKICVYLSGVCDWIYITHCIIHQCCVDIFFIDWEKPRGYLRSSATRSAGEGRRKRGSKKPTPISAWRTIMMANEWCKLGTVRKTSIELTLIVFIFVMVGCDFQYVQCLSTTGVVWWLLFSAAALLVIVQTWKCLGQ